MTLFYTLIFAILMLIDWARISWAGAQWAPMVNLVGILLAVLILSGFSWKKVTWKPYILWWCVCFLVAGGYYPIWYDNQGYLIVLHYISVALNIGAIGTVGIRFLQDKLWCRWNRPKGTRQILTVGIWVFMSLYMCLSPMNSVWPIWFLVLFGAFYLMPFGEDRKRALKQGVYAGIVTGFYAIQIWAFGFRPYDEIRYKGAYSNSNMNGMMYMITYMVLLVKMYEWFQLPKNGKRKFLLAYHAILLAGVWGFMFMTGCRTAIYVSLFCTVVWGVVLFIQSHTKGLVLWRNVLRTAVVGVTSAVLVALVFPMCYMAARYLPCILHHPVWWEGEYQVYKVHSYDPWDSAKYTSFDVLLDSILERYEVVSLSEVDAEPYYLVSNTQMLSDLSNTSYLEDLLMSKTGSMRSLGIRGAVYLRYLSNLNMLGHETVEGHFKFSDGYVTYHAQNVWIQIAFYYGLPAGVALVLLTFLTGERVFRNMRKDSIDSWELFSTLIWICFFGYGALEVVWYPGMMIFFLIFLIQKDLKESEDAVS